jgi:nitroreductase
MDVIEAIYHRRAVREYTSELVDQETLKSLIHAAIQA